MTTTRRVSSAFLVFALSSVIVASSGVAIVSVYFGNAGANVGEGSNEPIREPLKQDEFDRIVQLKGSGAGSNGHLSVADDVILRVWAGDSSGKETVEVLRPQPELRDGLSSLIRDFYDALAFRRSPDDAHTIPNMSIQFLDDEENSVDGFVISSTGIFHSFLNDVIDLLHEHDAIDARSRKRLLELVSRQGEWF